MTDKIEKRICVFEGSRWEADLLIGLLKSNNIESAIKYSNTDSAIKSLTSNQDKIFVNAEEKDKALAIIEENKEENNK